jgi:hypothetical protein
VLKPDSGSDLEPQSIVEILEPSEDGFNEGVICVPIIGVTSVCLPKRIEDDDESFCAATATMCKSSNEGSEEIHMTITIIALGPGKRSCERGPAGQGQKNVGGDENKHYRGRDEKNGATRKDAKSGESWVVKIKSKWLCFVNNHGFRETEREETHQPVSLAGKRNYKTIESWGERWCELASFYAECCVLGGPGSSQQIWVHHGLIKRPSVVDLSYIALYVAQI